MKSKEFVTENRIATGVGKTTVFDPSSTGGKNSYSGDPTGKHIGNIQERNFEALSVALNRNGIKFDYLGWNAHEGQADYLNRGTAGRNQTPLLTTFVMTGPGVVWEKYEGYAAGGGRNTIYVGGYKMATTAFLRLTPKKQDHLLNLKPEDHEADVIRNIPASVKKKDPVKVFNNVKTIVNDRDYRFLLKLVQKPNTEWTARQWQRYVAIVGY